MINLINILFIILYYIILILYKNIYILYLIFNKNNFNLDIKFLKFGEQTEKK